MCPVKQGGSSRVATFNAHPWRLFPQRCPRRGQPSTPLLLGVGVQDGLPDGVAVLVWLGVTELVDVQVPVVQGAFHGWAQKTICDGNDLATFHRTLVLFWLSSQ